MIDRDRFLAMVGTAPLMTGDAIVILAGEDAEPRVAYALEIFRQNAAPTIVVTGGLNQPPRIHDAAFVKHKLVGFGVSPKRIIVDAKAMHTRDQAVNTVALAAEKEWRRLLLVASPYHIFRAHLTFLQALKEAGQDRAIRLVPASANQARWSVQPEGCTETRDDLFLAEVQKIEEYAKQGHVASYADGLDYLKHWELAA